MSRSAIEGLKPAAVWEQFFQLSQIPRESGNEEAVRNYIVGYAKDRGLETWTDEVGNVIIKKPATSGREGLPVAILQGHMDMVCEKNRGTEHDFSRDPIKLVNRGEWMAADGTTLGADNGIALAMALALVADDSLPHGPLELLFTVDEETGLNGAMGFEPSRLEGRILINLDSEEEDTLYIGCAGGINTEGTLPVQWETSPRDWQACTLSITGLNGGHSGGDIHKNLGNALLMGAALITDLRLLGAKLTGFSGGGKHNAIPRECFAELLIAPGQVEEAKKIMAAGAEGFCSEWNDIEPGLKIEFALTDMVPAETLTDESFQKVGDLLFSMPHGVIGMSRKIENLVETSTNMAQADLNRERLHILTSQRSSSNFLRDNAGAKVLACIRAAGGEAWHNSLYPGWNPNPASPLLGTAKAAFKTVMGHEPRIKAIHAGLECGVIGAKIPGIDMISFGPDLEMVHTPQERMRISSVEKIWNLLCEVLINVK